MAGGEYSTTVTLQDGQDGAADGAGVTIEGVTSFLVEISGSFSGLTANLEATIDGKSWFAVALLPVGSTTPGTLVAAATAAGLYRLQDCRGLMLFRARTSGSTGGAMTVKAHGVPHQVHP
jgi:hypothetical protein